MVKKQNKETGVLEVYVPALITEIREEVLFLNNEKKTPYRLGNCKITYPDGGEESVLTRFYKKSMDAHPNTFKTNVNISLRIQAEGKYAGRAVAHLPNATVNISRLLGKKIENSNTIASTNSQEVESDEITA